MRRPKNRLLVAGGVLVAVVGLLLLLNKCSSILGCDSQGLPRGPVTFDQVKTHPEGHLFFPGARVYSPIGGDEQRNWIEGGSNPAFAGAILISSDSPDAIYAWYQQWLLSHNWHIDRTAIGATVWLSYRGFGRGHRELFTVAVDDPRWVSIDLATSATRDHATVFEVRYEILPASP